MGVTIGICSTFAVLLTLTHGQILTTSTTNTTTSDEITETTEYGPISMVMDQLAGSAVDVSDRTSSQLQANIDRVLAIVTGNIESLSTNAMAEVETAIIEANQLVLDNPSCNPAWNLQQFTANVTNELGKCTLNLANLVTDFRRDGQHVMGTVQGFIQQMAGLLQLCQGQQEQQMGMALGPLNLQFGNSNNCFLNGITVINKGLAEAMHNASLFLVYARELTQQQVAQSRQCSAAVVSQVINHLEAQRVNCS